MVWTTRRKRKREECVQLNQDAWFVIMLMVDNVRSLISLASTCKIMRELFVTRIQPEWEKTVESLLMGKAPGRSLMSRIPFYEVVSYCAYHKDGIKRFRGGIDLWHYLSMAMHAEYPSDLTESPCYLSEASKDHRMCPITYPRYHEEWYQSITRSPMKCMRALGIACVTPMSTMCYNEVRIIIQSVDILLAILMKRGYASSDPIGPLVSHIVRRWKWNYGRSEPTRSLTGELPHLSSPKWLINSDALDYLRMLLGEFKVWVYLLCEKYHP